jgi:CPA2 family monovalent cation:H+ antiporter-2
MEHSVPLITTLAAGFGLAFVFGLVAVKLGLPPLVGYLFAGILIGPSTPGFVADVKIAAEVAEIGIMLLMFGVGLHFSLADLLAVRRIALPGAVVQMMVATAMGAAAGLSWGWPLAGSLVFGLALSVASTVVLLNALESRGVVDSANGRIAVGWLVVEDLAMVLVLVLLPPIGQLLAGGGGLAAGAGGAAAGAGMTGALWWVLGKTLLAVMAFVALMLVVGRRVFPWVLWQVTRTGSRELFTLCVVMAAITIAFGSAKLFGVSFALGAFFAGMVLRESQFSHRAAEETLPLRDAFAVLFFASVGMLFDPMILVHKPLHVLGVVLIIVLGKSLAAALLVLALGYPLNTALTVSASLAQIGEFSFILAGLGLSLGLLSAEAQSLVLAGALISIALNPLVFSAIEPLQRWLRQRSTLARTLEQRDDPLAALPMSTEARYLANQVVLVGYGRVGRRIAQALQARCLAFVVTDENRELVEQLRAEGQAAVYGNAVEPETLVQAHIADARMLVIATPETLEVRQMVEAARTLNPDIEVLLRCPNEEEARLLERDQQGTVFVGERELAGAMVAHVLARVALPASGSHQGGRPDPARGD